jgi:hypothetical protein
MLSAVACDEWRALRPTAITKSGIGKVPHLLRAG